ncbi:MAG TPA: right-handed parallel beta-helix repeat-containing protein [Flavihumibacter sp.]|nr:right-handed parallel beta-helix repeat-containing protein [Flavihumibacter sp.]
MTRILFCSISLLLLLSPAKAQDTIRLADYGYIPGSRQNAVPYVQQALADAKKRQHPVLVFAPGRYDFWPQYATDKAYFESNTDVIPSRRCPVLIEQFKALTIEGNNAEWVFHDRVQPITIDSSEQIIIRNLHIDWDIPLTAQAQINTVTDNYVDLAINAYESPYIIEDDKLTFVGEGWKSRVWGAMEFDKDSKRIVAQSGDNCMGENFQHYKATELEKGLVRLSYPGKHKPITGNWLVLRHSARDHAGVFIVGSKAVQIENLYLYHTAGLGILSQYSADLRFTNVQVVPNEKKNRILSGHDDGMHFSNCRGQITIDSCRFASLMDDPINIHGTSVRIIKKITDTRLRCRFMHDQSIGFSWADAGDTLGIIENESMRTVGKAVVTSFQPQDPREFDIDIAAPLPAGIGEGDALENLHWTPQVWIKRSYFGSNRARGILVSTPGSVLIENNVFTSSGSAILIAGDANGWYESGAVNDVLIRNNLFQDPCLTSLYQFCEGIISIYPEIPHPDSRYPFHRNIRIEYNAFNPFDYPVLYAKSVQGLTFSHNTIARSTRYQPFHHRRAMLSFDWCRQVEIKDNKLEGEVLGKNILLKETPRKEIKFNKQQGLQITLQ